jgi:hypothetical protein
LRYAGYVKNWVATGALAIVAVALFFSGPIIGSVTRIGEGAMNKIRKYKEARHELAEPKPPAADELVRSDDSVATELEGVEAERRKAYEKELVNVGYWQPRDNGERKTVERDTSDGPSRRSAMQARREDANKSGRGRSSR